MLEKLWAAADTADTRNRISATSVFLIALIYGTSIWI